MPGPMVEATTQLRIYWPFAEAGFALTMAPMMVLKFSVSFSRRRTPCRWGSG
jgi:hypothetical protein